MRTVPLVEALLQAPGIDVNLPERANGATPLEEAVHTRFAAGSPEIVKLLLKAPGIDVNGRNEKSGRTVVHQAALRSEVEILNLLVQTDGVDANAADNRGLTPLYLVDHLIDDKKKAAELREILKQAS
uniref:Ankyrin repeat domain-containing protein n=1 Tax=Haptolina brevifila TaxID=156173 RepID=A0A7S2ITL5_9EUKA